MNQDHYILADGRWLGQHGIGRFSAEVFARLKHTHIFTEGPRPLSLKNFIWLPQQLKKFPHKVFFIPGFNPVIYSSQPFVFTICDLIHLDFPSHKKIALNLYYNHYIKNRARRAFKIITISEYSKQAIMAWANLPEEKVINVSCGVSPHLTPHGTQHTPGYPYLLHIGNGSYIHKNIPRLLHAFSTAKISTDIRLILTTPMTTELSHLILQLKLKNRVILSGSLSESQLMEYYRGALAVVFPSLCEGFGLPVTEAMACGTPAMTSNVTSLPEVAGDAALLVDPYDIDSIAQGIEQIVHDSELRKTLISKGFEQIKLFSWDKTASRVQAILNEAAS